MRSSRLLTAAVLVPLLYALVRYLPAPGFFVLAAAAILLAQYEFYRLYFRDSRRGLIVIGLAAGLLLVAGFYRESGAAPTGLFTAALALVLVYELAREHEVGRALVDAAVVVLGMTYIGWMLGHAVLLRNLPRGEFVVLYVLIVTWMVDAGAYYVGRAIGNRKLAPRVSPNKTVEGALGGLVAGLAAAVVARAWLLPQLALGDAVLLGLLLSVVGQLGDLVESLFKRSAGVKDSGGWIPSHGGLLDKVDSLAFTTPACYYYLVSFKQYGRVLFV